MAVRWVSNNPSSVKALANEDTLLRTPLLTQMFPRMPARATSVADTNFIETQKVFLILLRNILCRQQMFPSLRRNIMGNNVSATMCPRLPGPLAAFGEILRSVPSYDVDLDVGNSSVPPRPSAVFGQFGILNVSFRRMQQRRGR